MEPTEEVRVGVVSGAKVVLRPVVKIDEWRQRPLVDDFPCAFLDGVWLKRSWGGEVKNVSVLIAIGVA
jgi:putative transposase